MIMYGHHGGHMYVLDDMASWDPSDRGSDVGSCSSYMKAPEDNFCTKSPTIVMCSALAIAHVVATTRLRPIHSHLPRSKSKSTLPLFVPFVCGGIF
jgi:hypothetical protein